jgi:hypothetical protein
VYNALTQEGARPRFSSSLSFIVMSGIAATMLVLAHVRHPGCLL